MKLNNKGFSLVEVSIAVAVSTIVFGVITALIVFASNSSRQTNARITLQNEAKDAVNHMEAYIIEAQSVVWDSTSDALVLVKDSADAKEVKTSNDTLSNVGPKVSVFNTAKRHLFTGMIKRQRNCFLENVVRWHRIRPIQWI